MAISDDVKHIREHRKMNGEDYTIHRETSAGIVLLEDGRTLQEVLAEYDTVQGTVLVAKPGDTKTQTVAKVTEASNMYGLYSRDGTDLAIQAFTPIGTYLQDTWDVYIFETEDGTSVHEYTGNSFNLVSKSTLSQGDPYYLPGSKLLKNQVLCTDYVEIKYGADNNGLFSTIGSPTRNAVRALAVGGKTNFYQKIVNQCVGYTITLPADGFMTNVYTKPEMDARLKAAAASCLSGKTILAIGDSMVAGHTVAAADTWLRRICDRVGATAVNKGTNGARMTQDTESSYAAYSVYNKVCDSSAAQYISDADIQGADYILVYAGTNDIQANVTLGEVDSTTVTEFCGAVNAICESLQTRNPTAHIGFITPQMRGGYGSGIGTKCKNFATALEQVCAKYSIPVYNQCANCGINWGNTAIKTALTLNDSYHLNAAGHEWISYKYEHFINGL